MVTVENLASYYREGVPYKILSRKFEADLPLFKSHEEARTFFKGLFGDQFMLQGSEGIGADKIYFYTIIHNRLAWEKGITELTESGSTSGIEFAMSSQDVQLNSDGRLHIVY
ncbi:MULTISPECIES: hypothetical protein [Paenibacillus]|uniref:hypothetical protein n=1 Tax=Paenibacillus TaxID=44249 RepID=UPI0009A6D317|nr:MULTISPECIES: hypothetical protein [Paenibacillus]MCZ1269259.1 hypothetical protein [Paenibacillus tundrae]SLK16207.1 hypothetical protein SAMN06272722_11098 [Paenibacillus sp. RU5A]SOC74252.1 hypothetical protein SAMN05880581_11098 [Paenibacillus sp. RU26A]SOC76402.1 hypothetical protein SAMN05880586_11098 [Paenibacillus sp. RU5M]